MSTQNAAAANTNATAAETTSQKIRLPVSCTLPHTVRVLPNGLTLIVVQDKDNTTPAASMTVGVGSYNDPVEFPGLAHFCEHMLFMGTAKYPKEDEYEKAVARSGGHTNAWTAGSSTTYYFTSGVDSFKSICEMFVDFFVAPTFNPSGVQRELNAVHSEDEKNHSVDFWRLDELLRGFAVPEHPRSRYGNGNLTTLRDEPTAKGLDICKALRKFFDTYYVAGVCCMAVYSSFDAESMIELLSPLLSKMKTGPPPPRTFLPYEQPIVKQEALGKWYNIQQMSRSRHIQVSWVVPFGSKHYLTCPLGFASHVLGHEAKGSIIALLRELGWATHLVCGCVDADAEHGRFYVDVTLTDEGMNKLPEVVKTVFEGIAVLRNSKTPEGTVPAKEYEDYKKERELGFAFVDVPRAESHCTHLTGNTVEFCVEHAFSGQSLVYKDDLKAQYDALSHLTPEKCAIFTLFGEMQDMERSTSTFKGALPLKEKTRFHSCNYSVAEIPKELLEEWGSITKPDSRLHLLATNPYLTNDFSVVPPATAKYPEHFKTKYGPLWTKANESTIRSPKTKITVSFYSPHMAQWPMDSFYLSVLNEMLNEELAEKFYFAELAGFSGGVHHGHAGLTFSVDGPSATTPTYLCELIRESLEFIETCLKESKRRTYYVGYERREELEDPDEKKARALFDIQRDRVKRALEGKAKSQPYILAADALSIALGSRWCFNWEQILGDCYDATYEGLSTFIQRHMRMLHVEAMVSGNLADPPTEGKAIIQKIEELLKGRTEVVENKSFLLPVRDVILLPLKQAPFLIRRSPFSEDNVNAAVVMRIQVWDGSPRAVVIGDCLSAVMSSPFFNTLRTTETLGYIVSANAHHAPSGVVSGFTFIVQSAVAGPLYLYSRILAFLDAFEEQLLAKLTQEELDVVIKAQIDARLAPAVSVAADHNRHFNSRFHKYGMDHVEKEVDELRKGITPQDLQKLFSECVSNNASHRRAIVCMVDSKALPERWVIKDTLKVLPDPKDRDYDPSGNLWDDIITVMLPAKKTDLAKEGKGQEGEEQAEGGAQKDGTKLVLSDAARVARFRKPQSEDGRSSVREAGTIIHVPFEE